MYICNYVHLYIYISSLNLYENSCWYIFTGYINRLMHTVTCTTFIMEYDNILFKF